MAENFGQRMNRLKRAKRQQIADEHKTDAVVDDASVFSPEGEVIRPMAESALKKGFRAPLAFGSNLGRCISIIFWGRPGFCRDSGTSRGSEAWNQPRRLRKTQQSWSRIL